MSHVFVSVPPKLKHLHYSMALKYLPWKAYFALYVSDVFERHILCPRPGPSICVWRAQEKGFDYATMVSISSRTQSSLFFTNRISSYNISNTSSVLVFREGLPIRTLRQYNKLYAAMCSKIETAHLRNLQFASVHAKPYAISLIYLEDLRDCVFDLSASAISNDHKT